MKQTSWYAAFDSSDSAGITRIQDQSQQVQAESLEPFSFCTSAYTSGQTQA